MLEIPGPLLVEEAFNLNDACAELVRSHSSEILAIARRRLGNADLAQDAVQIVLLTLWLNYRRIRGTDRPLRGWLAGATRYVCNNIRIAERRRVVREGRCAALQPAASALAEHLAIDDRIAMLDAAMQGLPAEYRDLIISRFYQGRCIREIARQMQISEPAARKRLSRAVGRLRALMDRPTRAGCRAGPLASALSVVPPGGRIYF